jgi:hypothetical protein
MSNFKVTFTLKQHTPIIHFQANQMGATLRATELKPKLDRFLLNMVKDLPYKENANGHKSLEYKVKIVNKSNSLSTPKAYVNSKKETDKTVYQAPYFADAYKSVLANNNVEIEFFTFNSTIQDAIKKYIDIFFIYENFGTRQNKGFGSFLRTDIKENEIKEILAKHQNPVFSLGIYTNYQDAFKKIDTFYKKLKMGINKPYFKSLLFRYMCNTYNIGWEKKFIKQNFPEVIHGDHQPIVCKDNKEFKYIRAVLGLAEHNEFRPQSGKKQVKIESKDNIKRFKSPITFKVFNNKIYILFNDSYKKILDKEFTFKFNKKNKTIKTPQQFDLYRFLKFVEKETKLISEVQ